MRQLCKWMTISIFVLAVGAPVARADEKGGDKGNGKAGDKAADAGGDMKAEAKAATKIENKEPVEPGTTFKKGDTIYVWSSVTGASGKKVQHIWKVGGKEVRKATFPIKSARWRMNSKYANAGAGDYTVEVVADDQKLTEVSFKVE